MPPVNIPPSVRFALYLISAVGSVVVSYLLAESYIGENETALWAGLVAIINAVAASHVQRKAKASTVRVSLSDSTVQGTKHDPRP